MGAPALALAVLAILLLVPLRAPAAADTAGVTGCGRLCGDWVLDPTLGTPPDPVIDAALAAFRDDPPPRRRRAPPDGDPIAAMMMDLDEPEDLQRRRARVGEELRARLVPPPTLQVTTQGADLVLGDPRGSRRFRPGEPHAWVDAHGTATIDTRWQRGALQIEERYDRRRWTRAEYVVSPDGMTLTVTRRLRRPGLEELTLLSVYRRASRVSPAPAP